MAALVAVLVHPLATHLFAALGGFALRHAGPWLLHGIGAIAVAVVQRRFHA